MKLLNSILLITTFLLYSAQWTEAAKKKRIRGGVPPAVKSTRDNTMPSSSKDTLRRRKRVLKSGKDLCQYDPVQHPMDQVQCPEGYAAVFNHDDCAWECKDVQQEQQASYYPQPRSKPAAATPVYYTTEPAPQQQGWEASSYSQPQTRSGATSPVVLPAIPIDASQTSATPQTRSVTTATPVIQPAAVVVQPTHQCPSGYILVWNNVVSDYQCIRPGDISCPQGLSLIYNDHIKSAHCGV